MSNPAVKKGLEVLTSGQNIEALRRLIVMTIVGRYLRPASTNDESGRDDSLSALLSRLPTKTLVEVASISKGKTGIKDASPGTFPLVVTAEARGSADHFDFEGPGVMIPMVSSTGHGDASLKRIHYQDGQYAVGSILAVVQPKDSSVLSARYLHAYLSAFKDELLVSRMVGTANVSLTVAKISEVPVPLLPIVGQTKIDELMALCDRLEAEQTDAEAAHAKLVETLLGTLPQSTDAAELAANWQRLAEHFDTLFTTESSLDALKQTILQLAVMGKLVPQDPNDEPANELLKRIAKERARLEAEGVCKKSKATPLVGKDEQPFNVPQSWRWARLGSLCSKITDGEHATPRRSSVGHYLLSARNVTNEGILLGDVDFVPPEEFERIRKRCDPNIGDVLISCSGSVGRVALVDRDNAYSMVRSAAMIRPISLGFTPEFAARCLRSPLVQSEMVSKSRQSAQANLFLGAISSLVIPLPPLAEQHRIVAKVDELIDLCDRLKADIAESRTRQARLSATLIESALQAA